MSTASTPAPSNGAQLKTLSALSTSFASYLDKDGDKNGKVDAEEWAAYAADLGLVDDKNEVIKFETVAGEDADTLDAKTLKNYLMMQFMPNTRDAIVQTDFGQIAAADGDVTSISKDDFDAAKDNQLEGILSAYKDATGSALTFDMIDGNVKDATTGTVKKDGFISQEEFEQAKTNLTTAQNTKAQKDALDAAKKQIQAQIDEAESFTKRYLKDGAEAVSQIAGSMDAFKSANQSLLKSMSNRNSGGMM